MGFSNYWFDEKFQELPQMCYFSEKKALDVTKSCVNIVPAGLKGVEEIRLRAVPIAIAPDFKGKVVYEWGCGCRSVMTDENVKKAKRIYQKHKQFCETPHTWAGNAPHGTYYNLPKNMHFITLNGQTFLDLRKSEVDLKRTDLYISGVKAVVLPSDAPKKAKRVLRRIRAENQKQRS